MNLAKVFPLAALFTIGSVSADEIPTADTQRGTLDNCTPTYCGTPVEIEPNDVCGPLVTINQLDCEDTLYAYLCAEDDETDFFRLIVPPLSRLTVKVMDGPICSVYPPTRITTWIRDENCQTIMGPSLSRITLNNHDPDNPAIYYYEVRRRYAISVSTPYVVRTECCVIESSCERPIVVPQGDITPGNEYHFQHSTNTCCEDNIIEFMYGDECGTSQEWASGPETIYLIHLLSEATIDIHVSGPRNNMFMVFTDCADPEGTCVASSNKAPSLLGGTEIIDDLLLSAGWYYIAVSLYSSSRDDCDDITLDLWSDQPLAVELSSFNAQPGDAEVRLLWTTSSESDNHYFEVSRDGDAVGRVNASNSILGGSYDWTDVDLINGRKYSYALIAVNMSGIRHEIASTTATPVRSAATVTEYALYQNFPNPFNPETNIAFDLVEDREITLKVYNPLGQELATLVSGSMPAGRHTVSFQAGNLPSGIYFYRLVAGDFTANKKMVLLK